MRYALPVVLLLLCGCADRSGAAADSSSRPQPSAPEADDDDTLKGGFDRLKALACAKETARFFALVDRGAMLDAFLARQKRKGKSGALFETFAKKGFDDVMAEWERDVDRGEKGFLCQLERVQTDHKSAVFVKRSSGGSATMRFEHRGQLRWVLVDFESE